MTDTAVEIPKFESSTDWLAEIFAEYTRVPRSEGSKRTITDEKLVAQLLKENGLELKATGGNAGTRTMAARNMLRAAYRKNGSIVVSGEKMSGPEEES